MATVTPTKTPTSSSLVAEPIVALKRRTLDSILIGAGAVLMAALFVAGALLTWGSNFAGDYVYDELSSQNVKFADAAKLEEDGLPGLVKYAEQQVDTGKEAEAFATVIATHMQNTGEGMPWEGATYADMGAFERQAKADVTAAKESGASEAEIAELQATADKVSADRNTQFKGETLRGLLLTAYAWDTVGSIAGYAAIGAFVAGVAMLVLVLLGLWHHRKVSQIS